MDTTRRPVRQHQKRPPLVTPTTRDDVIRFDPLHTPSAPITDLALSEAVTDTARQTALALSMALQRSVAVEAGTVARRRASSLPHDGILWIELDCGDAANGALLLPFDLVSGLAEMLMGGASLTGRHPAPIEVKLACEAFYDAVRRWSELRDQLGYTTLTPLRPGVTPVSDILENRDLTVVPLDITLAGTKFTVLACLPRPVASDNDGPVSGADALRRLSAVPLEVRVQLPPIAVPLADLQQLAPGHLLATNVTVPAVVDIVSGDKVLGYGVLGSSRSMNTVTVEALERMDPHDH